MKALKLRAPVSAAWRRSFATAQGAPFVPPASLENLARQRSTSLPVPTSPSFYTGRSVFYDHLASLERAAHHTRQVLTSIHLMPLPKFALDSLPPLHPVWKTQDTLSNVLETKLTTSRYRRMVNLLNELNNYRRIAETAGHMDLGRGIGEVLEMFEKANKEMVLQKGKRKPVKIDEFGRSYTLGKRKTSSARVWMISSQHSTPDDSQQPDGKPLPITQILVNNVPLNQFFPVPSDRERILRPFRVSGLLGAYNVFALVRGGGTTGQSDAIAHGIAKGLVAHVPDVAYILKKARLTRRDPRMVERKKTGLAKARKRYAWVKR